MQKNCYAPELGHFLFYNSNIKKYECPKYLIALLENIDKELCRIMWNKNQKRYESPFKNSGNVEGFDNGTFEVYAFDWNEEFEQKYNFKYKDIEISWYKYLGRDMSMNKSISEKEAIALYNDCINSLLKEEEY